MKKEGNVAMELVLAERDGVNTKDKNRDFSFVNMTSLASALNTFDIPSVDYEVSKLADAIMEGTDITKEIKKVEQFDRYTYKHSIDVSILVGRLATYMNWDSSRVKEIMLSGVLHDIGKIVVEKTIINAPRKLTTEEFEKMKAHPRVGYEMLKEFGYKEVTDDVLLGVLEHHETENGEGYPDNKTGENISLFAKMIHVADVFSALTTDRSYKNATKRADAMKFIRIKSGEVFDAEIAQKFYECTPLYYPGERVELSNGSLAEVICCKVGEMEYPRVMLSGLGGYELELKESKLMIV